MSKWHQSPSRKKKKSIICQRTEMVKFFFINFCSEKKINTHVNGLVEGGGRDDFLLFFVDISNTILGHLSLKANYIIQCLTMLTFSEIGKVML